MKSGVYSYDELKGKIKVGDKVKSVEGKQNPCLQLGSCERVNNQGEIQEVTKVEGNYFYISGCPHAYEPTWYLEVINHTMTPKEKKDYINKKIDSLRKELEEKLAPKFPARGNKIYWISSQGFIKSATYRNDEMWKNRHAFIGLFKTEEEAEAHKKKIKDLK